MRLSQQYPTLDSIRESGIHRAILSITDIENSTSWPGKLTEVAELIAVKWEARYGALQDIRVNLFGPGGRLHGIAEPHEANRRVGGFDYFSWVRSRAGADRIQALVEKWTSSTSNNVSLMGAYEHGHLDFKPGQWVPGKSKSIRV